MKATSPNLLDKRYAPPRGRGRFAGFAADPARLSRRRPAARGPQRPGMSLLELVIATSMFATMLTSVCVILRTGRQVWEAHEAEFTRVEAAQATVRHVVRRVRQADGVSAISAATDDSGHLELSMPDGTTMAWDHDENTNCVNYGIGAPNALLSTEIAALRFQGFRADGITPTTVPDEVRSLRIEVSVSLPAGAGAGVFSSWAWVRSW